MMVSIQPCINGFSLCKNSRTLARTEAVRLNVTGFDQLKVRGSSRYTRRVPLDRNERLFFLTVLRL